MNIGALAVLSMGMSMDAFAGAITRGSEIPVHKKTALYALQVGLVFGIIEAIAPTVGYLLGAVAEGWISTYDHWVSFVLLGGWVFG